MPFISFTSGSMSTVLRAMRLFAWTIAAASIHCRFGFFSRLATRCSHQVSMHLLDGVSGFCRDGHRCRHLLGLEPSLGDYGRHKLSSDHHAGRSRAKNKRLLTAQPSLIRSHQHVSLS